MLQYRARAENILRRPQPSQDQESDWVELPRREKKKKDAKMLPYFANPPPLSPNKGTEMVCRAKEDVGDVLRGRL